MYYKCHQEQRLPRESNLEMTQKYSRRMDDIDLGAKRGFMPLRRSSHSPTESAGMSSRAQYSRYLNKMHGE